MAQHAMYLAPDADDYLGALHRTDPLAARRIEEVLDLLEHDYGDARARVQRWRQMEPNCWGVPVRGQTDDYWVLWRATTEGGQVMVDVLYVLRQPARR